MKFRGKFKADGAFIAEGEENFNPELLAEKLVDVSIEIVPVLDSKTRQIAEKISEVQGIPFEIALDAVSSYGTCLLNISDKEL